MTLLAGGVCGAACVSFPLIIGMQGHIIAKGRGGVERGGEGRIHRGKGTSTEPTKGVLKGASQILSLG